MLKTLLLTLTLSTVWAAAQGSGVSTETLTFASALELAGQGPAVKLAQGELALAQAELRAAAGLVSASLSGDVTQRWDAQTGASSSDIGPITAQANFNVVPYGDNADAVTRARNGLARAQAALAEAQRGAVVSVVTQYLETLRYTQEAVAEGAALAVAQTALEATQSQLEAGAASSAAVLDAQIALSEAQNDLAAVALEREQALAELSQTLGVRVAALAGEPPAVNLPDLADSGTLLENRSDLLSARLNVAEAELSKNSAVRSVLPSGSLSAGYGSADVQVGASFSTETYQPALSVAYDPDGSAQGLEDGGNGVTLQAGLDIPLSSATGATLEAAEQSRVNAEGLLEQTRAQARLELQAAQAQLTTARSSLASAAVLTAQRQQSLSTTRERLELGLVPAYEVQRAEAELLQAEVDLARLEDNVLLAQLALLQTLAVNPLEVF